MSEAPNVSAPSEESGTHDQLRFEREKLSLEQARIDLDFKGFERGVTSKIELLKLITQNPELRDEAIRNWQQVFPTDAWLTNVTLTKPPG